MQKHFADRLTDEIKKKQSAVCVGLDPRLDKIPASIITKAHKDFGSSPFKAASESIITFNKGIIDAVFDLVPVVKPQVAFYEIFGEEGMRAYRETLDYAHEKGLLTIADVKRNDIGSTAEAYAQAFLSEVFDADSVTVNAYLGSDGVKPFIKVAAASSRGLFVLVKTSNKSSGEIQDLFVWDENTDPRNGGRPRALYEIMGHYVDSWGADEIGESGYSLVGAVVGATYPEQAKVLREIMPNSYFLVPGYGAQGGSAKDVAPCFNKDGLGAVVNSSRGIIFAYEDSGISPDGYAEAAREAAIKMKSDLALI